MRIIFLRIDNVDSTDLYEFASFTSEIREKSITCIIISNSSTIKAYMHPTFSTHIFTEGN